MSAEGTDLWKGLFEWSMRYQDGTHATQPRQMSEEDRLWLEEALKSAMVDLGKRMQDIKQTLDQGLGASSPRTLEEKEQLLDELMEIVESIDLAKGVERVLQVYVHLSGDFQQLPVALPLLLRILPHTYVWTGPLPCFPCFGRPQHHRRPINPT